MQGLIDTASTTFETTIGFPISDVVDTGVGFLGLVFGTGLAYFTELLPVVLAVVGIYLVYRIAKMGWGKIH